MAVVRDRRPQWRGERKAVLVRMPVEVAQRLAWAAQRENRSVSEHAAAVLAQILPAAVQVHTRLVGQRPDHVRDLAHGGFEQG